MGIKEQFQDKADRMKDEARRRMADENAKSAARAGGPAASHPRTGPERPGGRGGAGEAGERMRDERDRAADRAEGHTEDGQDRHEERFDA
jgi:hypothetical protein